MSKSKLCALIGMNATGKTQTIEILRQRGLTVVPEEYVEADSRGLDCRLMVSKWSWIARWQDQVLATADAGATRLVSDRCPFDSAAHLTKGAEELTTLVEQSFEELKVLGVEIHVVCLHGPFDCLVARVQERLKREPWRARYHENSREELLRRWQWYDSMQLRWDATVDVETRSSEAIADVVEQIV